ncbi:MAG: CocE/NonD family hydrolase [Anaerolineae bacterium]|nr:CocE/NonD family hydrolase [Anaerolineae bacterium]
MKRFGFLVILLVVMIGSVSFPATAQDNDRVSRPGVYRGYSEAMYDEWVRESRYVEVRDGTQLAVDIYRPAVDGVPVDDPLPVLWTHHRYHRANVSDDGRVIGIVEARPSLQTMLKHGYVIAAVDVRGGGASFGTRRGPFTPEEAQDAYDMTEWFAAQPWCDGNVGMYGLSYLAITQYMAASTQPPHLKAIFPMMAMYDLYDFVYHGGILHENFVLMWGTGNVALDNLIPAAPVDADTDQTLLKAALKEHRQNWNIYDIALANPYRDGAATSDNTPIYNEFGPANYLDQINESGVAIYTLAGWYDMYPRDAALWFNNLTVPQKIVFTPWSHNGSGGFDIAVEHLRWFDYWLKGIDNGIMDEPPIYYRVMGAPGEGAWRFADQWPLPAEQPTPYYLAAGPAESVDSVNDGLLSLAAPTDESGQDAYTVDYTTTTGRTTRWTDGYGGGFGYPDMTANDEKGLTYTTLPFAVDTEITGHPVAHLWVSADVFDFDVMVYLEEVDARGQSTYITEGILRASHRDTQDAPWHMFGLPYHSGLSDTVSSVVPGEIVELVFDLHPTSNIFDAGHQLRITITGADADTYLTPEQDPPPTITVYRNADYASYIVLPVIPAE